MLDEPRSPLKVTRLDAAGLALVTVTLSTLALHASRPDHASHAAEGVTDAGAATTSAVAAAITAFVDVNVVPMDSERVLRRQVVLVEDGTIRSMGPVGTLSPPPGARVIRGDGSEYLVPGLTDAHVHLSHGAREWLPLFVANGVTTVFNLRGDESHLTLRDAVAAGRLIGPTVYTSGPFTNEPRVRTRAQALATVEQQARRGFDFVKIHGDLPADAFEALMEAGRTHRIAVVGHAPRNLPFSAVLENRMPGVVHAEELIYTRFRSLDEADLDEVAADMAMAGTWLTPTLSTFGNIATQWGTDAGLRAGLASEAARFMPPRILDYWQEENPYIGRDAAGRRQIDAMFEFQHPLVRVLHAAGIPMLAGTDAPLPVMAPGFSIHAELAALSRAGLSHFDALATATRNPGRFVREHIDPAASFGTVAVGARADLLLVSGNPLLDLDALRSPKGVMSRGRWYDAAALAGLLEKASGR